jgi:hypothetical protein
MQVMGHSVKDMTSTKVVTASLEFFPSSRSQGEGHHLQVHCECLHDHMGHNPVNRPAASSSTPSGTQGAPSISLPKKLFLLPVEPRSTDVARTADLPPSSEIPDDDYDTDDESDDLLDLSSAAGKLTVSLKKTEFFLKKFANRMGQANYSSCNKWKNGRVAGFLEKMHQSIILGRN